MLWPFSVNGVNMEERKYSSKIGCALFAMAAATYMAQLCLAAYVYVFKSLIASSRWFSAILVIVGFYFCGLPVFWAMMKKTCLPEAYIEKSGEEKRLSWRKFPEIYVMCMGLGYIFSILGVLISSAVTAITGNVTQNPVSQMADISGFLPMVVLSGILAPLVEEIIFRKILLKKTLIFGERAAVIFTSAAFALVHMNLYQFFYAFVIGVILGRTAILSGDIKYCIALHSAVNLTGSALMPFISGLPAGGTVSLILMLFLILGGVRLSRKHGELLLSSDDSDCFWHPSRLYFNLGVGAYVLLCIAGFIYSVI